MAGQSAKCGRWWSRPSANVTDAIAWRTRRRKRRWPGRSASTGRPRPWWSASATARSSCSMASSGGRRQRRPPLRTLSARVVEVDEATAKAAIYGLNRIGTQPSELEEAWLVHALVREDGLTQVRAAELLGRHKSWVVPPAGLAGEGQPAEVKAELRPGTGVPRGGTAVDCGCPRATGHGPAGGHASRQR